MKDPVTLIESIINDGQHLEDIIALLCQWETVIRALRVRAQDTLREQRQADGESWKDAS